MTNLPCYKVVLCKNTGVYTVGLEAFYGDLKKYRAVLEGFKSTNKALPSYTDLLIHYDPFYLNDM